MNMDTNYTGYTSNANNNSNSNVNNNASGPSFMNNPAFMEGLTTALKNTQNSGLNSSQNYQQQQQQQGGANNPMPSFMSDRNFM